MTQGLTPRLDETIKNESIVFIRANRTFAGLDPDTGLQ